jgi:hypothetical protein
MRRICCDIFFGDGCSYTRHKSKKQRMKKLKQTHLTKCVSMEIRIATKISTATPAHRFINPDCYSYCQVYRVICITPLAVLY